MKKIFAAVLLLATLFFPAGIYSAGAAGAEQSAFAYTGGFDMDAFLMEFTEDYPDRPSAGEESDAALYLAEKFFDLGYRKSDFSAAGKPGDYLETFTFSYYKNNYKSRNVVAVKRAAGQSKGMVIMGALRHVYSFELYNPYTNLKSKILSKGAYDNGSGVAVMMSVAHDIKDADLPFDVIFVAFGAEELGLYGSRQFVASMTDEDKENTLLMINLDCIAAGDYLYLFSKDWHTPHDGWLRERAEELSIPLRALPIDRKYMLDTIGGGLYSHYGYYSDNYYFLKENLNTAFFMTMNWESKKKAGVVESDFQSDIMHTSGDDYETLTEYYPDTYLLYMQYVSELVTYSLRREDFADAMVYSRENTLNADFIMDVKNLKIMSFSAWLVFIVAAYLYYGKLKKRSAVAIKEYMDARQKQEEVFDEFSAPRHKIPQDFSVFGSEFEDKHSDDDNQDKNNN